MLVKNRRCSLQLVGKQARWRRAENSVTSILKVGDRPRGILEQRSPDRLDEEAPRVRQRSRRRSLPFQSFSTYKSRLSSIWTTSLSLSLTCGVRNKRSLSKLTFHPSHPRRSIEFNRTLLLDLESGKSGCWHRFSV